jgi:uncharacterized membrane protein YcjF (UPF0283 family)
MNLQSMTFSDIVMSFFTILFFFAYLILIFQILTDIYRDDDLHIVFKVVWIVLLLFIPVVCSIVYLLIRGREWRKDNDIITINILTPDTTAQGRVLLNK